MWRATFRLDKSEQGALSACGEVSSLLRGCSPLVLLSRFFRSSSGNVYEERGRYPPSPPPRVSLNGEYGGGETIFVARRYYGNTNLSIGRIELFTETSSVRLEGCSIRNFHPRLFFPVIIIVESRQLSKRKVRDDTTFRDIRKIHRPYSNGGGETIRIICKQKKKKNCEGIIKTKGIERDIRKDEERWPCLRQKGGAAAGRKPRNYTNFQILSGAVPRNGSRRDPFGLRSVSRKIR